jgi:hypothetical protein
MKTRSTALLVLVSSAVTLPAAVTINTLVNVPNGSASGGAGTGTGSILQTDVGSIQATTLATPTTTYTVSNVDLTSVGGTDSEEFSYTITYTQTNGTGVQFNGFGNVSVTGGDNNQVDGSETLTATVALTATSFANLTLVGFTQARAGGATAGESATFTWTGGGTQAITTGGTTIANGVTGDFFTLSVSSGSTYNIQGFGVQFVAVPEPTSASLLVFGAAAMLRRRRRA